MTVRILADFHHHALYESYRLLFEDRFGWEVYRPIGMDWYDRWIWSFEREWHGDAVAKQYLAPWADDVDRGDYSERPDRKNPGRTFRMVTLDQFHAQSWDYVIASVPANEPGFYRIARDAKARYVVQCGNQAQDVRWDLDPLALVSSTGVAIPRGSRHVIYRQEFDLDIFRYEPPDGFGSIRSFVNCFPETPEYPRFRGYVEAAPDFRFEVFGAYGTAPLDEFACGDLEATPDIADEMRKAGVIWHAKYWSDGFGHAIHNAFAVGRPVFGSYQYYRDKLAGSLWVDGVTSIDIDRHGPAEVARLLREIRDEPDRHRAMCIAAAERFRSVVDFDGDAEAVRTLLES